MSHNDEFYRSQALKRAAFTSLVRDNLPALLAEQGYKLIHDNRTEDRENSHNWVFKLIFSGKNVIEIRSDDWRDYTEYFSVFCDGFEKFVLCTDDYPTAETAFEDLKRRILERT